MAYVSQTNPEDDLTEQTGQINPNQQPGAPVSIGGSGAGDSSSNVAPTNVAPSGQFSNIKSYLSNAQQPTATQPAPTQPIQQQPIQQQPAPTPPGPGGSNLWNNTAPTQPIQQQPAPAPAPAQPIQQQPAPADPNWYKNEDFLKSKYNTMQNIGEGNTSIGSTTFAASPLPVDYEKFVSQLQPAPIKTTQPQPQPAPADNFMNNPIGKRLIGLRGSDLENEYNKILRETPNKGELKAAGGGAPTQITDGLGNDFYYYIGGWGIPAPISDIAAKYGKQAANNVHLARLAQNPPLEIKQWYSNLVGNIINQADKQFGPRPPAQNGPSIGLPGPSPRENWIRSQLAPIQQQYANKISQQVTGKDYTPPGLSQYGDQIYDPIIGRIPAPEYLNQGWGNLSKTTQPAPTQPVQQPVQRQPFVPLPPVSAKPAQPAPGGKYVRPTGKTIIQPPQRPKVINSPGNGFIKLKNYLKPAPVLNPPWSDMITPNIDRPGFDGGGW